MIFLLLLLLVVKHLINIIIQQKEKHLININKAGH